MLALPEQLLLASVGDDGLEATGGSERMRYSLAGAMLLELHWLRRISLDDEPVAILDRTPCPHPWVATVQAAMQRPKRPASTIVWLHALRQLCPDLREQGLAALVAKGALAEHERRMLGAMPYAIYGVRDTVRRQELVVRLERAARASRASDEPTQALAALVLACGLERVLSGREPNRLKPGLAAVVAAAATVVQVVERDVREGADAYEASKTASVQRMDSPTADFRPL